MQGAGLVYTIGIQSFQGQWARHDGAIAHIDSQKKSLTPDVGVRAVNTGFCRVYSYVVRRSH